MKHKRKTHKGPRKEKRPLKPRTPNRSKRRRQRRKHRKHRTKRLTGGSGNKGADEGNKGAEQLAGLNAPPAFNPETQIDNVKVTDDGVVIARPVDAGPQVATLAHGDELNTSSGGVTEPVVDNETADTGGATPPGNDDRKDEENNEGKGEGKGKEKGDWDDRLREYIKPKAQAAVNSIKPGKKARVVKAVSPHVLRQFKRGRSYDKYKNARDIFRDEVTDELDKAIGEWLKPDSEK